MLKPRIGLTLAAAFVLGGATAQAQFPPESLENLSVLPSDMEVREVIDIMRGFAQALGVRCQHCHVGRAGQPLSEFDFVSDEKPAKETARDMLQMVWAINQEYVAGLANHGDPPLEVQCAMCHRGQARLWPEPCRWQESDLSTSRRDRFRQVRTTRTSPEASDPRHQPSHAT